MGVKIESRMIRILVLGIIIALAEGQPIYGDQFQDVVHHVQNIALRSGMLSSPFKVGEYNKQVVENYPDGQGVKMKLNYSGDTIGFIFMYDHSFIAYKEAPPIMASMVQQISQQYPTLAMKFFDPNVTNPETNLTYLHVQTAGNAAGMAFYYQSRQVIDQPSYWQGKSMYGSSVSPEYRLNTTFAGTIVFSTLLEDSFIAPCPVDIYKSQAEKIMLIDRNYMFFYKKCPFDDIDDRDPNSV